MLNRIARSAVDLVSEQKRAMDLRHAGGVQQNSGSQQIAIGLLRMEVSIYLAKFSQIKRT